MEHITEYTEREIKEIHLALIYASHFRHGTAGHNGYMTMASLARQIGFDLDEQDRLILPSTVRQVPNFDGRLK